LRHHVQEFNRAGARFQSSLLFVATVALLVPSMIAVAEGRTGSPELQTLSTMLAVLLIGGYVLGLVFSLKTHKEAFASSAHEHGGEDAPPLAASVVILLVVTVLVALVSEVFVGSVEAAGEAFGMSPAFVGFIVVALVGAAAEIATAFSAAAKDRLDLSVSIALGSAVQIALFVAPLLVLLSHVLGPAPMGLDFWPGAVVMMLIAALTATILTSGGRSTWFLGVAVLMVYAIFGLTLYVLPPLA
jgi:Ca2+:H+ antiporter